MAKNHLKNKNRLIEVLILAFVIVSASLLVIQLASNVVDALEQSQQPSGDQRMLQEETVLTPTASAPRPTPDLSAPISDMN